MYRLNANIINSPIFQSFIETSENEVLYLTYINNSSLANKENLEIAFATHAKQVFAVSYLKKLIYFESRRFDKKRREFEAKQPAILNANKEENTQLIDMIEDPHADKLFQTKLETSIEEVLSDNVLIDAVLTLTNRQKDILFYYYVLNWSDPMIAKEFNVSQQAIAKTRKKALQKMHDVLQ
ncbi:MAG: hypothetical protein KBT36_14365 [Kurthia sp.]|nr:hypothetical protein [Candidatus Kurthia equi]